MATSFIVDDDIAKEFRDAVEEKHGTTYKQIGKELRAALETRITYLKKTTVKKEVN